jgi:aspartyl-tRNA(Asn)/glutamyl-tRNA(Gln) amidotransferase subunit B
MKYVPTIGIECHVQLKTKSKLFAAVDNDARAAKPNDLTSPICFGLPGTLPVLNEQAVALGIKAGIALNAEIAQHMKFDRKHYFYPDLPKGYQITQFDQPIVGEGWVEYAVDGEKVKVGIERAHLEEDAGKSTHPNGETYSLVDLNRAGTPLLEVVSKPDMHSPAQARGYAQELYNLMKFAEVSNVDLYHGNMRFDVNVSIAPVEAGELGTRAEVKNLNSFKAVERATAYEIKRQTKLLERGEDILQETRGWDDSKQKTVSQRSKENAHDYRYFPEPDIPPIKITQAQVDEITNNMPMMPSQVRVRLIDQGVSAAQAEVMIGQRELALIATKVAVVEPDVTQAVVNWLATDVMATVNDDNDFDWSNLQLDAGRLIELAQMVADNKLSSNGASDVVKVMMISNKPPATIADEENLLQISDEGQIEKIVDAVIESNPDAANDVRNGEQKAIGFLVGQVMKQSQGQANPKQAKDLLTKKLGS